MIRTISQTESGMLLTCQAQWDFNYGGYLAGTCLRPKAKPILLQEGSAWGAGVAAYHAASEDKIDAAIAAMANSLERDAAKMREGGVYNADEHRDMAAKLRALLDQYDAEEDARARLGGPLDGLQGLEHELIVPLPSRSGKGDSSRYRLQVFFDGLRVDEDGRYWLVEFKLRNELSALELISNSRQLRYYAWAYEREYGQPVAGVVVDERLNEQPKPARWVKGKKDEGIEVSIDEAAKLGAPYSEKELEAFNEKGKIPRRSASHAKDQLTTVERYLEVCEKAGVEPERETVETIGARRWSQRHRIFLDPTEVEQSGPELISLGRQIAAIDSGQNYPVRNVKPQNCRGCRFKEICNNPGDTELVDSLFLRVPAKRDLQNKEASPA